MDDGQGVQAQEVHLEHARFFDVVTVILRGPDVLACLLVLGKADGNIVREVARADNGGAGVHPHLADAAFQLEGVFQHLLVEVAAVIAFFLEVGDQAEAVFQGNFYVHVLHAPLELLSVLLHQFEAGLEFVVFRIEGVFPLLLLAQARRNHIREAVGLLDAHVADAGDILDGALGRHRTEGNHAGNVVLAVFPVHIFVGHRQAFEIHVDIRHVDAVRIEEALEQQVILDRVEIRDFQAVGDDGAGGGAAPGPDHRTGGARSGDIVLDDEEVVREAHPADGL